MYYVRTICIIVEINKLKDNFINSQIFNLFAKSEFTKKLYKILLKPVVSIYYYDYKYNTNF